jgi:ABC-type glutathione transport system ATPase component
MALRMALTEQTQRLKRRRVMSETVIATTPHLGKDELARIDDLSVSFMTDAGSIKAIDGVDFTIPKGKVVGVVGESGPANPSRRARSSSCCR